MSLRKVVDCKKEKALLLGFDSHVRQNSAYIAFCETMLRGVSNAVRQSEREWEGMEWKDREGGWGVEGELGKGGGGGAHLHTTN